MGPINSTLRNTAITWIPTGKYHHPIYGSISAMSNAPELYEFSLLGSWPDLVKRCASHPNESLWSDKFKNNALHLATRRQPPVEVILALMKADPNCSKGVTVDGLSPLHYATYCGASSDVINLLVKSNPQAVSMVDRRGRTPLHCACAGFRTSHRYNVIKILLEADASIAVMPDEKGVTPLSLMYNDYSEEVEDALYHSHSSQVADPSSSSELKEYQKITALLLRAAYCKTVKLDKNLVEHRFQILHAAVGVPETPHQFVKLLLKYNPDSVREKDADGNLPLHVAAKTRTAEWIFEHCQKIPAQETDPKKAFMMYCNDHSEHGPSESNQHQMKKIVRYEKSSRTVNSPDDKLFIFPHGEIIQMLLKIYPMAAHVPDSNGKLPFHLALEAGKSWDKGGLSSIFENSKDNLDNKSTRFSLMKVLADKSHLVRMEAANTCKYIYLFWKHDDCDAEVEEHKEGKQDCDPTFNEVLTEITKLAVKNRNVATPEVKASMLCALAAIVQNNYTPSEDTFTESDIMDVARSQLFSENEEVREGAAKVIGSMGELPCMEDEVMDVINFQLFQIFTSVPQPEDVSDEVKHGKACAIYRILLSSVGSKIDQETYMNLAHVNKSLIKDSNTILTRRAACLSMGSILARSSICPSIIKDVKGPILKCMKPTENAELLLDLARGLRIAVRMNNMELFRGKTGLPILDAALLLSVTGIPLVQQAYINFLWLALDVGGKKEGLNEYMSISRGENGRIMMNLVTKVMQKIDEVEYI